MRLTNAAQVAPVDCECLKVFFVRMLLGPYINIKISQISIVFKYSSDFYGIVKLIALKNLIYIYVYIYIYIYI